MIDHFDHHCQAFISNATFLVMATSDGMDLDVSPKGDPAGFVEVENETTLLLPDRPGNNRLDGMMNILAHPQVALLFMIPTVAETLRVNGTAEILDDPETCDRFQINGRSPLTVIRITAEEVYTHCGKAPLRGGLWKPETWPSERPVVTLGEMIRDHAEMDVPDTSQDAVDKLYRDTMY